MAYEYVNKTYGVNAQPGMRVTSLDGKYSGTIARKKSYDHYVHVIIDGRKFDSPFHPLDLNYGDVGQSQSSQSE